MSDATRASPALGNVALSLLLVLDRARAVIQADVEGSLPGELALLVGDGDLRLHRMPRRHHVDPADVVADRRRLFERDGHLSAASWLATTFKVAWGTAREHVRIARALEEMPETRQALDAGELSMSAVRVLVATRDADPSAFGRCEKELVEAARIHSMNDLQRVAA